MLRSFGPVHALARSLWCPCVFPNKKENRSVSPTHSFARCVGMVGRLGRGRAHVRMDSSRLYSSSKPTSDPGRSPTCVRLSV